MYEFLGNEINTLDYGRFQLYQNGLIHTLLDNIGMYNNNNGLLTPTKVEANIGTDDNVPEDKIYWTN